MKNDEEGTKKKKKKRKSINENLYNTNLNETAKRLSSFPVSFKPSPNQ